MDTNPLKDAGADPALLDGWLDRAELARQLALSVDTLQRWETRRVGPPCVRVGRKVLYRKEAVPPMAKGTARTFGQDLMRGEHVVGAGQPAPQNGSVLMPSHTSGDPSFYAKKRAKEAELGRELTTEDFLADHYAASDAPTASGTSIFDPVLSEIAYRWFCPPGGTVLDPFAGGSVRGIIAARLGRPYVGIELRAEQVAANQAQTDLAGDPSPRWIAGDSRDLARLAAGIEADLVFSCPPYWNLERYSDDPSDLSTMPLHRCCCHAEQPAAGRVDAGRQGL